VRKEFERWAVENVGQPDLSGYHGTGGVWLYRHNIMQLAWRCWQDARAQYVQREGWIAVPREIFRADHDARGPLWILDHRLSGETLDDAIAPYISGSRQMPWTYTVSESIARSSKASPWTLLLARLFGTKVAGIDEMDGKRTIVVGYRWRGVLYMTDERTDDIGSR
jgi:hypothetical protein